MNLYKFYLYLCLILFLCCPSIAMSVEDEDCLECHGDPNFVIERDGVTIPVYVNTDHYGNSVHSEIGCTSCHADIDELPHAENLNDVNCSDCHEDAVAEFINGLHGQSLKQGKRAPNCVDCHTKHHIQAVDDQDSPVAGKNLLVLCSSCHGGEVEKFRESLHGQALANGNASAPTCATCHGGHAVLSSDNQNSPTHAKNMSSLCGQCHETASDQFDNSLHGKALQHEKYLAPNCTTCHETHSILPPTDERSSTYVMNIPPLCGQCHKEGTPVSQLQSVDETHVLEDYSQSIHGDGLYKRGLIVTAVCTSCHTSHNILPHEDPASSIHHENIAETCMQCHHQIEDVHVKVIRGELWEEKPHEIPACVDCHAPHKIRRVFYEDVSFLDETCMECHRDPDIHKVVDGKKVSLHVDYGELKTSVHRANSCIKCHTNVSPAQDPVCLNSGKVDCSTCHAEEVEDYHVSQHGTRHAEGDSLAPYCTDCHGAHDTPAHTDSDSPTFARNIPALCGRCHSDGKEVTTRFENREMGTVESYSMSIHGKGLLESGLTVTATCVDCHTAHRELPTQNPNSTVNKENIPKTCGECHSGIYDEFRHSIHSPMLSGVDKELPVCDDCHESHTIQRVDMSDFRQQILNQCGECHEEVTETYFETFHGKVSKLGSEKTARCHDCHGAHNILPPTNPNSTLSRDNIVETCKTCHPNSNRKFVGYLTHATHHDKHKYPYLYYTFWFMTILLVGTFTFFGVHTLLWLPRGLKEHLALGKQLKHSSEHYYERFDPFSRFLHVLVIISFLSLAITGMIIKFSGVGVFQSLSRLLGGYEVTGFIHRVAAIITFLYFFLHLGYLVQRLRTRRLSIKDMLYGERSMVPNLKDLTDFIDTIKWFVGLGPRPQYGKWTYWEKFDYFAVFWGVAIIGASGLILWFPEFFTEFFHLPGWLINVATIIHSDEALLASGFIFTIHFFNTHLRPDKFPMDPVIFTGRVPIDELKYDRPHEYEIETKSRRIKKKIVGPPSKSIELAGRIFGFVALAIGIITIILIIYAMIFLYR